MRIGTIIGLAVVTAALAAMLTLPTFAAAESTVLCKEDPAESACPEGKVATHVHFTSTTKGKLVTSAINVECDVLFLGDPLTETVEPLVVHGNFTYSNCNSSCVVTEENGPSEIKVLREGTETANVTGEGLVHVNCTALINCFYDGVNMSATAKGPLSASHENGEVSLQEKTVSKESGALCPKNNKLYLTLEPLEKIYLTGPERHKTALCTTDEKVQTCSEEHKPSTMDLKDSAVEFLTSLVNSKCEGLISGTVGGAGKPQEVKVESKFSSCTNSCAITEVSAGSQLFFLSEGIASNELTTVTTKGLELFLKCGEIAKCAFGPLELTGHGLGPLATKDNGHITFSKASLGNGEGLLCPSEASLDALFVPSSATYIREDYTPVTALCSKDEGNPVCKTENQLKTIDYKDTALELLTNLINVKCEGLASGSVGEPGSTLEVKPELTFSNCGGGCFVTVVSGPGKVVLERLKSEEAKATAEGFETFVKCGTTIKCLLGPEKLVGTAIGALTTGDNGHLTFSKASLGKGEGATCPTEATLDATYVASSAAYIG